MGPEALESQAPSEGPRRSGIGFRCTRTVHGTFMERSPRRPPWESRKTSTA